MTRKEKAVFFLILALGAFLIFFRLGRQDMLGDDALYGIRAAHYFDYLASAKQTTPVQWFGERPAWSYLSFHDHPPMFELIQRGFFAVFGESVTVSRLTSAFAALGSIAVIFFLGRRFGGVRTGLLSMAALALNTYFIWLGRIGLLESLMIFWSLLGLLFLVKGVQDHPKFFTLSGVFFGAAFMTKYTVFFILFAALLYLLIWQRGVFRERNFWLGALLFVTVISPVLIYNFKMQQTRGHFDVLFADVLGQEQSDWVGMERRVTGRHFVFVDVMRQLSEGVSWPYFGLFAAAAAAIALRIRRSEPLALLPLLITVFLILVFSYLGSVNRWVAVLAPFTALLIGIAGAVLLTRRFAWIGGAVLAVYFLVFTFNTNHAVRASEHRLLASPLRLENLGYNQLEKKLSSLLENKRPDAAVAAAVNAIWYGDIKEEALDFPSAVFGTEVFPYLIVYDDRMQYFPTVWTFERRKLYRRFFTASSDEYLAFRSDDGLSPVFDALPKDLGIYFMTTKQGSYESGIIQKQFEEQGIGPEIVYDDKGREAFYLYDGLKKP